MEPQIIQVYALQQAMEQLAGRRKDLAAVHYEKVLELYEMQTGRLDQPSLSHGSQKRLRGSKTLPVRRGEVIRDLSVKSIKVQISKTEKQFAEKIYQTGNGKSEFRGL